MQVAHECTGVYTPSFRTRHDRRSEVLDAVTQNAVALEFAAPHFRAEKDFVNADKLKDFLRNDLKLSVNDKAKTFRVWQDDNPFSFDSM